MLKMKNDIFLSWSDAFQQEVPLAGGKGWNLGRLERYGFTVPAGGVLSTHAFQVFVLENHLQESIDEVSQKVTINNIGAEDTETLLATLREKIMDCKIPSNVKDELASGLMTAGIIDQPVAVRSSATAEDSSKASFAGIHTSFLNVTGIENISKAIIECYASLWTTRAVTYRRKMEIPDCEVLPAVVIMEMVNAKAAGIVFTCDPRTGEKGEIIISANFGLGESVVGGAVEPDLYYLDGRPHHALSKITKKKIGLKEGQTVIKPGGGTEVIRIAGQDTRQVLPDHEIVRLSSISQRVLDALGDGEQDQDIEWVFDGQEFKVVQARPITVEPKCSFPELEGQVHIWSNANMKDVVPMVLSTLERPLFQRFCTTCQTTAFKDVNYSIPKEWEIIKYIQGRAYVNLSVLQWCYYDTYGVLPKDTNLLAGGHQPEIAVKEGSPYAGVQGLKRIWRLVKSSLSVRKAGRDAPKYFNKITQYVSSKMAEDFTAFSDIEFIDIYNDCTEIMEGYYPIYCWIVALAMNPVTFMLRTMEKRFSDKAISVVNGLMTGGSNLTSAEQGYELIRLAEIAREDKQSQSFFEAKSFNPLMWEERLPESSPFKQLFRTFLEKFGHRGVYETELSNPRWNEDPSYPLEVIRSTIHTADLGKIKARQKEKEDRAWQEINQKLSFFRRALIRYWVKEAKKGAELREMSRSVNVRLFGLLRKMSLEIGRRFTIREILKNQDDIFHCAFHEIFSILTGNWDGIGLDFLVAERKAQKLELDAIPAPDLIMGEVPQFTEPVQHITGNGLAGMSVAAGTAAGIARLIRHPDEGKGLQSGDIMVVPSTDPGWTPLFLKVSAIVMETGGFMSHGAIVAREYGIPAVVNIPGVMNIIKDGQNIVVDGDEGKVYLT